MTRRFEYGLSLSPPPVLSLRQLATWAAESEWNPGLISKIEIRRSSEACRSAPPLSLRAFVACPSTDGSRLSNREHTGLLQLFSLVSFISQEGEELSAKTARLPRFLQVYHYRGNSPRRSRLDGPAVTVPAFCAQGARFETRPWLSLALCFPWCNVPSSKPRLSHLRSAVEEFIAGRKRRLTNCSTNGN